MSTKEIIEESDRLLLTEWLDHEKELVVKMVKTMVDYKRLIPKALKEDVLALLVMANRIKLEYDALVASSKTPSDEEVNLEPNRT